MHLSYHFSVCFLNDSVDVSQRQRMTNKHRLLKNTFFMFYISFVNNTIYLHIL